MESVKLSTPNDLSFNYYEFSKDTFSVDQFLQDHRNMANLETMRDDLGIYLKSLRSAMIELINKDYADFVNLSTNLIGLDKGITNIQLPLGQLKEELLMLQLSIEDVLSEVSAQLLKRKTIQDKKHSLQSLNKVFLFLKKLNDLLCVNSGEASSLKPLQMERAAMEYNQLQFHVSWCESHLSDSNKQNLKQITSSLYSSLNNHFVECLNNNQGEQLYRVLNVYLAIDKSSLAEDTYRKEKVSPVMKTLINEESLASNPRGLPGLFDSLIAFIDNEMKDLRKATQLSDRKLNGFDFVLNSYWPEVEERLELDLSSIYAPGNPENFFSCYNAALQFLEQLERRCDRKALRKHPLYQNFMLRWNLPVYFQIRFQEIAGSVEEALLSTDKEEISGEWKLSATKAVWQSLFRCWEDKVFITQLTHRFWKLNLQILGRYYTWSKELLQKKGKKEGDQVGVNVWVWLYSDVASLTTRLDELFQVASSRLPTAVPQATRDQLYKCLDEQKQLLMTQLPLASARLVQEVCAPSSAALRHVSEVPRLYRRTNREQPTRSLPYTDTMLEAPLSFHTTHHGHPQLLHWLQTIFSEITKQYYVAVMDVLTSVQKTEESLRRLKKIRDRNAGNYSTPDRGGDDDKIRMQLYFDANYYCKKIEETGVKKDSVDQLKELLKLVEMLHNNTM